MSEQETGNPTSASSSLVTIVRLTAAFLVLGVLDLVAGQMVPGPELSGLGEKGSLVLIVLGSCAFAGLALGAGTSLFLTIAGAFHKRGRGIAMFLLGVAALVYLNQETFSGAKISSNPRIGQIKIAFYAGGVVGVAFAVWIGGWILRRHTKGGFLSGAAAVLLFVGAAGALYVNVNYYRGQYPTIHTQLALGALIFLVCGPVGRCVRPGRTRAWMLLVALIVVGGALWVRGTDFYPRVASAVVVRADAAREVKPWTDRAFQKIRPAYKTVFDAPPALDIPGDGPEAHRKAEEFFRGKLANPTDYNVLLLSLDTLRADHCGFNGYDKNPTTPNLDKLAEDAFVFRRAYATYPTSNYSYSSAMTGLYTRATPAYGRVRRIEWDFPEETATPQLFASQGWKTVGISAFNAATANDDNWFGLLRRGFEIYNPDQEEAQLQADKLSDSVIGQLKGVKDRPFFMWAHYLDPHAPYTDQRFGEDKLQKYDGDIAFTDEQVGRLIDQLRDSGELKKTIIVMFSDHGEEFFEHGGWDHNTSCYEEQVHVPLFIRVPGVKGRAIDTVVSLADIHSTLTAMLGLKDPIKRLGRSLLPTMLDTSGSRPGVAYSDQFYLVNRKDADSKRAVIMGDHKLIYNIQRDSYEMYDLAKDPGEKRNLIGRNQELFNKLGGIMAAFDRDIDSYHLKEGEVVREPREVFREMVAKDIETLLGDVPKQATEAYKNLNSSYFLSLGDLSPDTLKFYTPEERTAIAKRLSSSVARIKSSSQRNLVVRILATMAEKDTMPDLRKLLTDKSVSVRLEAAIGLAMMGDKSVAPYLVLALDSGLYNPCKVAVSLARLSEMRAGPWILPALMSPSWATVGEMALQLPHVQVPEMGFYLRDFLTEGRWRPRTVQAALSRSLGGMTSDPELLWMLKLLTGSKFSTIKRDAEQSLRDAGFTDEQIAEARESVDLELEGALEIKNRLFAQGVETWRKSLEKTDYYNPGLRLRMARYLHLDSKNDEARAVLDDVVKNAPNKLDRELAARRIEQLQWPARVYDPSLFKLEVTSAKVPTEMVPNVPELVTVTVKNTGKTAIQGGYWQHYSNLTVGWVDQEGKPVKLGKTWDNFLLPKGLNPGEEIEMSLVAQPPRVKNMKVHFAVYFEQPWLKLDNPRIYVHEGRTLIPLRASPSKKKPAQKKPSGSGETGKVGVGIKLLDESELEDIAAGVVHSIPQIFILEDDGYPKVSRAGLVQLADDGPGFFYSSVLKDHPHHHRPGVLRTNNWGDIEAMCIASRVVERWRESHPDGPRLGMDEISAEYGGFPDYNGDGISDHKTHQTGHNINFILPSNDGKDKTICLGRQYDECFDPLMFRDLMDLLIEEGGHRFTTNDATRIADPTLKGGKFRWTPKVTNKPTKSPTFVVKDLPIQLILKTGRGNHSDHVNVMLWRKEK